MGKKVKAKSFEEPKLVCINELATQARWHEEEARKLRARIEIVKAARAGTAAAALSVQILQINGGTVTHSLPSDGLGWCTLMRIDPANPV